MKRKMRFTRNMPDIAALFFIASCSRPAVEECRELVIVTQCGETKAYSGQQENGIWDLNLFITGEKGKAEYHRYTAFDNPVTDRVVEKFRLLYGRDYCVYAIANAGFDLGAQDSGSLDNCRLSLVYPDHFERGLPMAARKNLTIQRGADEELRLERLVSKLTVRLDRSALDKDVSLDIAGAKVGNCPRWVRPFGTFRAEDAGEDFFPAGYSTEGGDVLDLYLAENVQDEKNESLCSYIEMDMDYSSDKYYTEGGNCLKYRFYIRENNGYRVERNSHYRVVVKPERDGLLCEDSWRVDKSGLLVWSGEPYLKISPEGSTLDGVYYSSYYEMDRGESLHFALASFPKDMKVWLREDLVQDELEDGRIEYRMDDDGLGFTAASLGTACTSMMEIHAGSPLDDYLMICICVR